MNARDKNDNVVYTISTKTYNNTPQKIKKHHIANGYLMSNAAIKDTLFLLEA